MYNYRPSSSSLCGKCMHVMYKMTIALSRYHSRFSNAFHKKCHLIFFSIHIYSWVWQLYLFDGGVLLVALQIHTRTAVLTHFGLYLGRLHMNISKYILGLSRTILWKEIYTYSSKALYIIIICDVTLVHHGICHKIFTNASTYEFYFIPINFQIYVCISSFNAACMLEIASNRMHIRNM